MTLPRFTKANKPQALHRQIAAAENQVQQRRRLIDRRTTMLIDEIKHGLTQTTTLLMAVGIGFIIAELTKCPHQKSANPAQHSGTGESSPLKVALTLLTSARTLYMALPVAWLMKSSQKRS